MGSPERDPYLHVVEHAGGRARALDRPQRFTRSAQLGNPPGYGDEYVPPPQSFPPTGSQQQIPDHYAPQQQNPDHYSQQQFSDHYASQQPSTEPPRPPRRPGHSDWEVCLRFPFGRLRFGGFIGWESD